MMQTGKVGLLTSGVLVMALGWGALAALPAAPVKVEAAALALDPQMAWARAVVFADVMIAPPRGRLRRMDHQNYLPMRLRDVGVVWVAQAGVPKFQNLGVGDPLLFEGTVVEFMQRYHIIVSDGYVAQAASETNAPGGERLGSLERGDSEDTELSASLLETLLADAQNSLNQLAQANKVTVAQLIQAQADGGQRIAENIVANALQGQLSGDNKTAQELMVSAVLSLLRMQFALQESVPAAGGAVDLAVPVVSESPTGVVEIAVWDMEILSDEQVEAEIVPEVPAGGAEHLAAAAPEAVPELVAPAPEVWPGASTESAKVVVPQPDSPVVVSELPSVKTQVGELAQAASAAAPTAAEVEGARQWEERRQARRKAAAEQQAAAQALAEQLAAEEQAKLLAAKEKAAAEELRGAEAVRLREAQRKARAEAKRRAAKTKTSAAPPAKLVPPAELPEWMQPVRFPEGLVGVDERGAQEPALAQQLAAEEQAQLVAAKEKKVRQEEAQRKARAEAKRRAAKTKTSEAPQKKPVDPAALPEWMQPVWF